MKVMNGLRMFIQPDNNDPVENNVFYSQRSHGPIYRWRYEKHLAKWQAARVHNANCSHELCAAPWQSVPQDLKAQLNEHYLE
jgi:hypothetical protein